MQFHDDTLDREEFIVKYLAGKAPAASADAFESHYLDCPECFTELCASSLLRDALTAPIVERRQVGDAVVVDFAAPSRLVAGSREYEEFLSSVGASSDTRVLIDLTRVTRVDSAGLGLLMRYYSRVLSNNGKFSVVKPSKDVEAVLEATGLARLLNISRDEVEALQRLAQN